MILCALALDLTNDCNLESNMDAFLEEDLYAILTYCMQNPNASDFEAKKQRAVMIVKELYTNGGADAKENMFYSIEIRIREEIHKEARHFRSWWNNISSEWKY